MIEKAGVTDREPKATMRRTRSLEELVALGKNRVHAVMRRADGTIEDLGVAENLRTTVGRDWQADAMGNPTRPAAAVHIGLTADGTAPAIADTALTGELTTFGLARKAGTFAHTPGTDTYTLTAVFTAAAGITAVTVQKAGLFANATGGPLCFESLLSAPAAFGAEGDELTLVWTVDLEP